MMQRYTFVVRVHPGEGSTVENLATQEQAPVVDLAGVGPQIERWVEDLDAQTPRETSVAGQEEEQ
jgi:hypothetical protein